MINIHIDKYLLIYKKGNKKTTLLLHKHGNCWISKVNTLLTNFK